MSEFAGFKNEYTYIKKRTIVPLTAGGGGQGLRGLSLNLPLVYQDEIYIFLYDFSCHIDFVFSLLSILHAFFVI